MSSDHFIFDTHAHYDDPAYDDDREELLRTLPSQGIGAVADIGANLSSSAAACDLAVRYDYIYAVVGVHPEDAHELFSMDACCAEDSSTPAPDPARMDELRGLAARSRVVAIGEIGLDYHYETPGTTHSMQREAFRAQLSLARELSMPVMIHSRDAAKDTLDIMRETHYEGRRADIHCFSYPVEIAREYLAMGYYLGIGGVLTFKNAKKLREVVEEAPLSQLLLETDAPYLAPTPHRGERNTSAYLPLVVEELAAIKHVTTEEVIAVTCDNARSYYGL